MAQKHSTVFVPVIDETLLTQLQEQSGANQLLSAVPDNISKFNNVLNTIPHDYRWEVMTVDAFKQIASRTCKTRAALYRFEWLDHLKTIEGFGVMSSWRLAELARSAVWAINRNDTLCAALMARAALETSAAYAFLRVELSTILTNIAKGDKLTRVPDLEEKLLKTVYASRSEEAEKFNNPTNIVTIIEKIAKHFPDEQVAAETYFALCEVAHPNLRGRGLYALSAEQLETPGHEIIMIASRHGPNAISILVDAITALSWSMDTFSFALTKLQECVLAMRAHLERVR